MARGARKTALEKLQNELMDTQNSIQQYVTTLETLREQEQNILQQIELEEFKSLKAAMEEYGLGLEDVKELINSQSNTQNIQQSA